MKELDPKLNEVLWSLAEGGNAAAQEEFLQMHPALREELERRNMMLVGLRSARPMPSDGVPPYYYRSELAPSRAAWRRLVPILAACGAIMIASASWVWWRAAGTSTEPNAPQSLAERAPAQPPRVEQGMKGLMVPHREPDRHAPSLGVPSPPTRPPVHPATLPRTQQPISVQIERATLPNALRAIAARAKIGIEIGPGLPDFEVVAKYEGMSAMQIFADMGRTYGFTAFDQDGSSVIIVPARDPAAERSDSEEGTAPAEPRVPGR